MAGRRKSSKDEMVEEDDSVAKAEARARRRQARAERKVVMRRLSQPLQRDLPTHELEVHTIRPMVDLAQWSANSEVRSDAAAGILALCQNEKNRKVLAFGGALGALLSMIDQRSKTGQNCKRDATRALALLCELDDIKIRLLAAPRGLEAIIRMSTCGTSEPLQFAALHVLDLLSTRLKSCLAVVERGGLHKVLQLLANGNSRLRVRCARVLLSMAGHELPPESAYNEASFAIILRCLAGTFLDHDELATELALLRFVESTTKHPEHQRQVVDQGFSAMLLHKLEAQHLMAATHVLLAMRILLNLLQDPHNHPRVLQKEAVLARLAKLIFEDLPQRSTGAVDLSADATEWLEGKGGAFAEENSLASRSLAAVGDLDQQSLVDPLALPDHSLRALLAKTMLKIYNVLAVHERNCDFVVNSEMLANYNPTQLVGGVLRHDRNSRLALSESIWHLTNFSRDNADNCQRLAVQGSLDFARFFLLQTDTHMKHLAARCLAVFSQHGNIGGYLSDDECLEEILGIGYYRQEARTCISLMATVSEAETMLPAMLEFGALEVLFFNLTEHDQAWSLSSRLYCDQMLLPLLVTLRRFVYMKDRGPEIVDRVCNEGALVLLSRVRRKGSMEAAQTARMILKKMKVQAAAVVIQALCLKFVVAQLARKATREEVKKRQKDEARQRNIDDMIASIQGA